jgi:hypothetical protein
MFDLVEDGRRLWESMGIVDDEDTQTATRPPADLADLRKVIRSKSFSLRASCGYTHAVVKPQAIRRASAEHPQSIRRRKPAPQRVIRKSAESAAP